MMSEEGLVPVAGLVPVGGGGGADSDAEDTPDKPSRSKKLAAAFKAAGKNVKAGTSKLASKLFHKVRISSSPRRLPLGPWLHPWQGGHGETPLRV